MVAMNIGLKNSHLMYLYNNDVIIMHSLHCTVVITLPWSDSKIILGASPLCGAQISLSDGHTLSGSIHTACK